MILDKGGVQILRNNEIELDIHRDNETRYVCLLCQKQHKGLKKFNDDYPIMQDLVSSGVMSDYGKI